MGKILRGGGNIRSTAVQHAGIAVHVMACQTVALSRGNSEHGRILPSVPPTYWTSSTWTVANVQKKKRSVRSCKTGILPRRVVPYLKVSYLWIPRTAKVPKIFRKVFTASPFTRTKRGVYGRSCGGRGVAPIVPCEESEIRGAMHSAELGFDNAPQKSRLATRGSD